MLSVSVPQPADRLRPVLVSRIWSWAMMCLRTSLLKIQVSNEHTGQDCYYQPTWTGPKLYLDGVSGLNKVSTSAKPIKGLEAAVIVQKRFSLRCEKRKILFAGKGTLFSNVVSRISYITETHFVNWELTVCMIVILPLFPTFCKLW